MKEISMCRVCHRACSNYHISVREVSFGKSPCFDYFSCSYCGCLQICEFPAALREYYNGQYYSFHSDLDQEFSDPSGSKERSKRVRSLLTLPRVIAQQISHSDMKRALLSMNKICLRYSDSILDVGCGSGRLLYQMHEAGWTNCVGVDPYLTATKSYNNGLVIMRDDLGNINAKFDLIMLHHVFEHVADPIGTLKLIAARLRPLGTCLIRIPLSDSHAFRKYGPNWVQLDAPRHFYLHTRKSMQIAAKQAGLRIIGVDYDSYEFQFWGSEQYMRDIPLQSPSSFKWGTGKQIFSKFQIGIWAKKAKLLNILRQGDQAAFYLRLDS